MDPITRRATVLKMDLVCRTCLNESIGMKSIFIDDGNDICKMLESCSGLNINAMDGFPTKICSDCLNKVHISYKFRQLCKISHNALINIMDSKINEKLSVVENELRSETIQTNIKLENGIEIHKCSMCLNQYTMLMHLQDHVMRDHPDRSYGNSSKVTDKSNSLCDAELIMDCVEEKYNVPESNVAGIHFKDAHDNPNNDQECDRDDKECSNDIGDGFGNEIIYDKEDDPISDYKVEKSFLQRKRKSSDDGDEPEHNGNEHMRQHSDIKPCQCHKCSTAFTQIGHLQMDPEKLYGKPKVTEEKKYLCAICDQRFYRIDHLQSHMRFHPEDQPYKCPYCNIEFISGTDLKVHVRLHTGKQFKCDICGHSFLHLANHKRNQHGLKSRFKCDLCGDSFLHLAKHKRNQHGQKLRSKCHICGENFLHLAQHKRKQHGIDEKAVEKFIIWFVAKLKNINID